MSKFAFEKTGSRGDRDDFAFSQGEVEGNMTIHPRRGGKDLRVVYVGANKKGEAEDSPNTIGPTHVRHLVKNLKEHYPKAERIYGNRIGGARFANMTDDEYDDAGGQAGIYAEVKLKR